MEFINREPSTQPRPTIGQPNDRYEQEADGMADQFMQLTNVVASPIQRKCEDCEEETLQMKPLSESITPIVQKQNEEEKLQMKASGVPVIQRSRNDGAFSDTSQLHQDAVDQYAQETGGSNQPGTQYSEGYAQWLQTREAAILNSASRNDPLYQRVVQSWPTTIQIWPRLDSKEAKIEFIHYLLSTDFTNCRPYNAANPGQEAECADFARNQETLENVCQGFATQLHLRFRSQAAAPEQEEIDRLQQTARIYFQNIDLRYRIPIQIATIPGHAFNSVLVGQNADDINDYLFIEPQTDQLFEAGDHMFQHNFRRGILSISDATEYNERDQYIENTQRTFVRNNQNVPEAANLSTEQRVAFTRMNAAIFIADNDASTWRATITDQNLTYEEYVRTQLSTISDDHVILAGRYLIGQSIRRTPGGVQEPLTAVSFLTLLDKLTLLDRLNTALQP